MMNDVKYVKKPWGFELWWAHTDKYVGKLLHIETGHRLSLQYHEKKDETIYVLKGTLELVLGSDVRTLKEGDSIHIEPGMVHRMIASTDCDVLEASTPEIDDVVRIDDAYGRS